MIDDLEKDNDIFSFWGEDCEFGEEDSVFSDCERVPKEADEDGEQEKGCESQRNSDEESDPYFVLDINEESKRSEAYRSKLAFGQYMKKSIGIRSSKKERKIELDSNLKMKKKEKALDINYEVRKQSGENNTFPVKTKKRQMSVPLSISTGTKMKREPKQNSFSMTMKGNNNEPVVGSKKSMSMEDKKVSTPKWTL